MSVRSDWPNPWPKITANELYGPDYVEYTRGSLKLKIMLQGASLLVETGHSLSLYSKILYDDFNQLNVFGRANLLAKGLPSKLTEIEPIADKNRIIRGETLYFAPDLYDPTTRSGGAASGSEIATLPNLPPPQAEAPSGLEIVAADLFDLTGIGEAATTAFGGGYVVYSSIDEFVDRVIAVLFGRKIGILHIQSHGTSDSIRFGDAFRNGDVLTISSFPRFRNKLGELTRHFARGAWVAVRACNAGQDLPLMRSLRDLWGVNLVAGFGAWNNILDMNYKDFLILETNGNEYRTQSMPAQIQHSLMRKYWRNLEIPSL